MFVFGSGVLIGTPQGGSPINFGLAQEVSLNIATTPRRFTVKTTFPRDRLGTRKMTGKAKLARISGQALGNLFFGVVPDCGDCADAVRRSDAVPSSSPYTYTTTFHTTFASDQGVIYAATGLPLKQVASGPATGQYSVSAGVYTFSSGDAGAAVLVSYVYTVTGSGENLVVASALIGPTNSFSANLFATDPTTGKQFSMLIYNCVADKLAMGTKLEDFIVPSSTSSATPMRPARSARSTSETSRERRDVRRRTRRPPLGPASSAIPRDQGDPADVVPDLCRRGRRRNDDAQQYQPVKGIRT